MSFTALTAADVTCPGGTLASTGPNAFPMIIVALILLAVGVAMVAAGVRRSGGSHSRALGALGMATVFALALGATALSAPRAFAAPCSPTDVTAPPVSVSASTSGSTARQTSHSATPRATPSNSPSATASTPTATPTTTPRVVDPDLTPTIDFDGDAIVAAGTSKKIAIYVQNISSTATTSPVRFRVPVPPIGDSSLTFDQSATSTTINGTPVTLDNSAWTITTIAGGSYYLFTFTGTLAGLGTSTVGLTFTNIKMPQGENYVLQTLILPGSGGDKNTLNNSNSATFTAA